MVPDQRTLCENFDPDFLCSSHPFVAAAAEGLLYPLPRKETEMKSYVGRVSLLLVASLSLAPLTRASVIVNTSLSLTQFQIKPSAGSIQFVSPLISPAGCILST